MDAPFRQAVERHVRVLAGTIGPRGSATTAEERASRYIADELRRLCDEVRVERFRSPSAYAWAYALFYALGVLASGLACLVAAGWLPTGALVPAALVGTGACVLFYRENTTSGSVAVLFRRHPSQNVVGILRPRGPVRRRAVLVAHYDSAKWGLMFDPRRVHRFRALFLGSAASLLAAPAIAASTLLSGRAELAWLALWPMAYLAGSALLLLHRELFATYVPGANDNASGVAAMLALAERFASLRPQGTELWFVATGCEEVGLVGMLAFLARHGEELRDADFLVLDNVGAGCPAYTLGEGMLRFHPSSPRLLAVARQVAREHPDWGVRGVRNTLMSTDALPAARRGYHTIGFRGVDARGLLPNWHWPTDTVDRVDWGTLTAVTAFVAEMLHRLDAAPAGADGPPARRAPAGGTAAM